MKYLGLAASCLFFGIFISCASQPKPQADSVPQKKASKTDVNVNVQLQVAAQAQTIEAKKSKQTSPKPTIIVIPAGTKNLRESVALLEANPLAAAAALAINNSLTNKQYNVISPEGTAHINEVIAIQSEVAEQDEDLSYIASLSFGADVYVKYSVDFHRGQILANLSAYESTSGRLLGTQSATVNDNGTNVNELVASAVHKALPSLLQKVQSYWNEDSKSGIPYKVILKFIGDFADMDAAHSKATFLIQNTFKKTKLNAMSEKTADITVYANPNETDNAYTIFSSVQKAFSPAFQVKKTNLVQHLLILEVSPILEVTP